MPLTPGAGTLGEAVCGRCGGRLLGEPAAKRVIVDELGISGETLRELAGHFGRPALRCPDCGQRLHPIRIRSLALDLCTGCGAVWLDAGELSRLSEGRWAEVAGPAADASGPPIAGPASAEQGGMPPPASSARTVLLDDDRPDPERLIAAFKRAGFRTAQDARTAALRGHGIVAEHTPADDAARLWAALAAEGLPARLFDPADLELPPAVRTKELSLDDTGLTLADALGRPIAVPWGWLRSVAVGLVRVAEAETELHGPEPGEQSQPAPLGSTFPPAQRMRTVIVERDEVMLDLVVEDQQARRGRFRATRKGMIFRSSRGRSIDARFRALVRELLQRVPGSVALSRGTPALRDEGAAWPRYRAVRDFELALRWVSARAHQPGGSPT